MNSENSTTSDPYRLLCNLLDKINLKRSGRYVALSKKSKKSNTKTINLKYQLRRGMKSLNYDLAIT